MWGYISGDVVAPAETKVANYGQLLVTWNTNNSKIITSINNSVDLSIGMQLAKFSTAKEIWDHLARLYRQSNFVKRYQIENDTRMVRHGDMSIQQFY